ncbi:MAG: hypothetical protein AAF799_17325 [Myxococcota bacterium]
MFVIFGDKHRTEPVADGVRVTRSCPKCTQTTEFAERVVSKQFRLYFVEMFTHGTHHVLECSSCGTAFVTDEVKGKAAVNDHEGTVFGHLQTAVNRGKQAIEDGTVAEALGRAETEANRAIGAASETLGAFFGSLMPSDRDEKKK